MTATVKVREPVPGIQVLGAPGAGYDRVLTGPALAFLHDLAALFSDRIENILSLRADRRARLAGGETLAFLPETLGIRDAAWRVAPPVHDLRRRFVEITGPIDRKMIINALNSGAQVFMADFEDSSSPTWANMVEGQLHLMDAVRKTIVFDDPGTGKKYRLHDRTATLVVRPRGLHLREKHVVAGSRPVPAPLFDFGLFFFHNARALIDRGSGPYFYLPKLESHLEARLWNDVFNHAQDTLGIPRGTIRATVLIETLPAAFQMDEILYELKDHSAGLNCGRWDYIFSFIKTRRHDSRALLPDRSQITMEQPFMRAYTRLAVRTCHRRGAHAIGGMAAQIPIRNDAEASARALQKVRTDKLREVGDGHDGTWVAHPGLVPVAREIFESGIDGDHQIDRIHNVKVSAKDLLEVPRGTRTEEGLRLNVRVAVQYLAAWLEGNGCVPLYHLMEDAATAEISRAQVWQWIHHRASLDDGRKVTPDLLARIQKEELSRIAVEVGTDRFLDGRFRAAAELFSRLCTSPDLDEFLTVPAYDLLVDGIQQDRRA